MDILGYILFESAEQHVAPATAAQPCVEANLPSFSFLKLNVDATPLYTNSQFHDPLTSDPRETLKRQLDNLEHKGTITV